VDTKKKKKKEMGRRKRPDLFLAPKKVERVKVEVSLQGVFWLGGDNEGKRECWKSSETHR